ncbi:hypothetical protein Tco_1218026 [Tanacetum coccineum]
MPASTILTFRECLFISRVGSRSVWTVLSVADTLLALLLNLLNTSHSLSLDFHLGDLDRNWLLMLSQYSRSGTTSGRGTHLGLVKMVFGFFSSPGHIRQSDVWEWLGRVACFGLLMVTDIHKKIKTRQKPDKTEHGIGMSEENRSRRNMHLI